MSRQTLKGDTSKNLSKCRYYQNDKFNFMHHGGPCWGEVECVIEGHYYSDPDYYLALETWIHEEWLCEGHKDWSWSYLHKPKKYRLVEIDEETDTGSN